MKPFFTKRFLDQLESLPLPVQKKFEKQLQFLLADLRHPSLRTKKYDEKQDTWQARVDQNHRFYFTISGDTYILTDIKAHPK